MATMAHLSDILIGLPLIRAALDFLFPLSAFERVLRDMTPEEFSRHAPRALSLENGEVLFLYRDRFVRKAIVALKYHGNSDAARIFASLLYETLLADLAEENMFGKGDHPLLIPIPLSKRRLRERGFNQVELVTERMANMDNNKSFVHAPEALIRAHHTKSQATLKGRAAREKNVHHAFLAFPEHVSGKTIILVDDVMTTGATMGDARRALRRAGARRIRSYALAH